MQTTRAQRQATYESILSRMALLGLTRDVQQIGQLLDIAKEFVETGIAVQGSIAISEVDRRIDYRFSDRPDKKEPHKSDSMVTIKPMS